MKLSVTQWQKFSLKKDIEKLNKNVQHACDIGGTVVFDALVTFAAVVLDKLFDRISCETSKIIYIIAVLLIAGSFIVLLFKKYIIVSWYKKKISVTPLSTREYIDSFDNEIWCYVMMSDSFLDLLTHHTSASSADNERNTFYYSQTCFWLNKAIKKLSGMNKLKNIFDNNNKEITAYRKISTARLDNLLKIIFKIKRTAKEMKDRFNLDDLATNDLYYDCLCDFVERAHDDLGLELDAFRKAV